MPLANFDYSGFGPQLDPRLVLQQIETMRYNVLWQKALVCPNRVGSPDNHLVTCTLCDRTGFLYDAGTPSKMLVMGISLRQMYQSFGRFDAGMATITAAPETKISWWDKVTLTESTIRYTEAVQRGSTATDKLRYGIVDTAEEPGVLLVRGMDGTTYTSPQHFSVVAGELVWAANEGPDEDDFYSVAYLVRPTYRILDINHQVRDLPSYRSMGVERTVQFPMMGMARLEFLIHEEPGT